MSKKTFEQALAKLEQLVVELEQGQPSLDLSLKKFDEGIQLAAFCGQKLAESRSRVDLLLRQEDGGLAAVPFSAADTAAQNDRADPPASFFQGNDYDGSRSRTEPARHH